MIPCSSFIELSFVSEPINCFKWLVAQVLLDNFVSSFLLRDDGSRHSRHRICLNRNVTKFGLLHQNVVVGVNATTAEVFGPKIKIQLFNRCLSFWVVLSIALDCKVFEKYFLRNWGHGRQGVVWPKISWSKLCFFSWSKFS